MVVPQLESPQTFSAVAASTGSYTLPPQPSDALRMTKEIVDTLRQFVPQIDGDRLYVTGLSTGVTAPGRW